jgi:hypothetical protein
MEWDSSLGNPTFFGGTPPRVRDLEKKCFGEA